MHRRQEVVRRQLARRARSSRRSPPVPGAGRVDRYQLSSSPFSRACARLVSARRGGGAWTARIVPSSACDGDSSGFACSPVERHLVGARCRRRWRSRHSRVLDVDDAVGAGGCPARARRRSSSPRSRAPISLIAPRADRTDHQGAATLAAGPRNPVVCQDHRLSAIPQAELAEEGATCVFTVASLRNSPRSRCSTARGRAAAGPRARAG